MFALNFLVVLGVATTDVIRDALETTHQELFPTKQPDPNAEIETKAPHIGQRFMSFLDDTDNRFQTFVSKKIDPLLAGHSREQQLQSLMHGGVRELSPQERATNRRLGLGVGASGLLAIAIVSGQAYLPYVIAAGLYSVWPWYVQAYRTLVEDRQIKIVVPIMVYVSWMWLSGHFIVGTLASLFFALFQKVRLITQIGARQNLISIFDQQPRFVWVDNNGLEVEIPIEDLHIGDVIILDAGQTVPVDGTVIDGAALIDQHRLTGEAQPVEKETGDTVLASSLMLAGRLRVKVEKGGNDTAAAQILEILKNTIDDGKDDIAKNLEEVEHTLWPMLCGGLVGWMIGGPITGAAILGCNYVIGTVPLKMINLLGALNSGANHSILIKDGRALETLNSIDVIVFDKTGTLTQDQPELVRIHALDERSENDILTLAATAEYKQTHPIALAILGEAKVRNLNLHLTHNTEYEIGYGIKVIINHRNVLVGSYRFMGMENIVIPQRFQPEIDRCTAHGISIVYIAEEGKLVGAIELDACLRPESKDVVNWLKASGMLLYIISGDQEAPTQRLANELGMDGYFANTLPDQKAKIVKELKSGGRKVCFIGDGINDAIALRSADVSVSFRAATNVASDNAQIILMNDDLNQLKILFNLGHSYKHLLNNNYKQSVTMSLIAGAAVIVLPYKFIIVESLFALNFIFGINIATTELLTDDIGTLKAKEAEEKVKGSQFLEAMTQLSRKLNLQKID